MSTTMITEGQALGILWGSLAVFSAVAVGAGFFVYKAGQESKSADFWYSARKSQGWVSLGLSFFASSMGAWVVFAAPETGANFGWWGTFGYAFASCFPFFVMGIVGPWIREAFPDGFCLTDWVRERFGRATQIYVATISVFYMWIYLVAELSSMGGLIRDFAGLDPLAALVPVSLVTMVYTMAAGLPASIWTDRAQGIIMVVFVCIACFACFPNLDIREEAWVATQRGVAPRGPDAGLEACVTLVLCILAAELMNMGTWQRVYSSKDDKNLRMGFAFGIALIAPTMILFGIVGMLAEAQTQTLTGETMALKFLAFFELLAPLDTGIKCVTFALGVCMVASSVDSLQTGLVGVLSQDVASRNLNAKMTTGVGALFVLAANIPAIIVAAEAQKDPELSISIINLFLIADVLALSIIVPVFMGLYPMATQSGCLAGCGAGVLTIMVFGWVEFGTFMAGLEMITLMAFGSTASNALAAGTPLEAGLFASRTTILCVVLPIITGTVTYFVSATERMLEVLVPMLKERGLDQAALAKKSDNAQVGSDTI
eukprot:CAMPEP_0195056760 /NCGR_PEP_ID=MMETSP0448-20130528/5020_1 /TAXON_ID=66468 /ORGANISM="Heterocapsa triquestra, Strain CCMP 448" /LENGTH=542 /DNA_ID=CAMNT_0040086605 /DNA_START=120 /DNA_END=1748 /DNA_ORIENTATION=+